MPVSQGLDAWGLSPPFWGAAAWQCWAQPFLPPTSRGQSRAGSCWSAVCFSVLSWNPCSSEQPLHVYVYDLCLRHVSELALAPAAAFPPGAKAGRSLLHAKAPQSIPASSRGRAECLAVCLSALRAALSTALPGAHRRHGPTYTRDMGREGTSPDWV